jgi:tetratricopeptide (TPR) repeat protein
MRYVLALFALSLLFACGPNADKMRAELSSLSTELAESADIPEIKKSEVFIDKAKRYVKAFPADTLSPMFLFQAAGLAKTIGKIETAFELWDQLEATYPESNMAVAGAFLKGFTAEVDLGDREKAIQYFKTFLERYPDSAYANDARRQILILESALTPDEMVKEFEKNPQPEGEEEE